MKVQFCKINSLGTYFCGWKVHVFFSPYVIVSITLYIGCMFWDPSNTISYVKYSVHKYEVHSRPYLAYLSHRLSHPEY